MSGGAFECGQIGRSRPRCTDLTGSRVPTAAIGSMVSVPTRSARYAGLAQHAHAQASAALLDIVAAEMVHLGSGIRRQIVESCRTALANSMTELPWRSGGRGRATLRSGMRGSG